MDGLSSVGEAHAHTPAATGQATRDVHVAVASSRHHGWLRAVGSHNAEVPMAEAASGLWAVGTRSDIACEVCLAHVDMCQPGVDTVSLGTSVSGADIREGFLFGAGSLGDAASCALALPVERAVTVDWVSRVDAEGCVLVPRGLTGMILAVRRVDSGSPDGVVDMLPVTAYDPTFFAATGGHRISSPRRSGARHEGVYNLDVLSHFDRWVSNGSRRCCGAAMPQCAVDVSNLLRSE